jgi:23S rRNA G2445 N2-methylase RlmL
MNDLAVKYLNIDKTQTYHLMGTVTHGIEQLVMEQIKSQVKILQSVKTRSGAVFFIATETLRNLMKIKCCDNLYLYLGSFVTGSTKDSFKMAMQAVTYTQASGSRIHVSASRSGKHSFNRFYAAQVVLEQLLKSGRFIRGDQDLHDLHFRLDIVGDTTDFSLKLTTAAYRFRGVKHFMPGAIRNSLANSLVWLSQPKPHDVFIDPFCGSGTILAEREGYPYRKILGFDINEAAVNAARSNTTDTIIRMGDACSLPLADSCIDVLVTNPPWGEQICPGDVTELYRRFFIEANRIVKPGGRMLILTDKTDSLIEQCPSAEEIAQISYHGLHPALFRIQK